MAKRSEVRVPPSHESIVRHLKQGLIADASVHAMWLEGSMATGEADDLSDIDMVVDVADGAEDRVFELAESVLSELAPLELRVELGVANPFLRHRVYSLEGSSQYCTIDFVVQSHSRQFVFDAEDAGAVRVVFDKARVIQFVDHPWEPPDVQGSLSDLRKRYWALRPWVIKQILRGKFVEAFGYYERWVLMPLLEALRLAYAPRKSDYYIKDASGDLPPEIVRDLETLFQVSGLEAFESRLDLADRLFQHADARITGSAVELGAAADDDPPLRPERTVT